MIKPLILSCLLASPLLLVGQTQRTAQLPFNPQDGETVVFLGDSITHQCLYTQYLETFFFTRYPERDIRFHNAGVSGDKAGDALDRFDEDVAAYEPDYVTILLGMNDGQYEDFNAETFERYRTDMEELLDRIEALGAEAIVLSPTMFDHHVVEMRAEDAEWRFGGREFSEDYNAMLGFFTGWCLEEARERQSGFVNFWSPLNELTDEQRRLDPTFNMVWDAIHPNPSGQMVMAYEVLWQLGVEDRDVEAVGISDRGTRWVGGKNVQDLVVSETEDHVTFSHQPESLPWVIPEKDSNSELKWLLPADGRLGYELTKAGHRLSADRLKIAGLTPGKYEVLINGQSVGTWTHLQLGTKVELQANPKTPQFQQALEVALLNQKRNDEAMRPLRDTWAKVKGIRRKFATNPEAFEAAFAELKPTINELSATAASMEDEIRELAQPQALSYEIRKVE